MSFSVVVSLDTVAIRELRKQTAALEQSAAAEVRSATAIERMATALETVVATLADIPSDAITLDFGVGPVREQSH